MCMCVCIHECRRLTVRLLGLFEALAWGSKKGALSWSQGAVSLGHQVWMGSYHGFPTSCLHHLCSVAGEWCERERQKNMTHISLKKLIYINYVHCWLIWQLSSCLQYLSQYKGVCLIFENLTIISWQDQITCVITEPCIIPSIVSVFKSLWSIHGDNVSCITYLCCIISILGPILVRSLFFFTFYTEKT